MKLSLTTRGWIVGTMAVLCFLGLIVLSALMYTNNRSTEQEAGIIGQIKACWQIRDSGYQIVLNQVKVRDSNAAQLKSLYEAMFSSLSAAENVASQQAILAFSAQNLTAGVSVSEVSLNLMRTIESVLMQYNSCAQTVLALQVEYAKTIGYPSAEYVGQTGIARSFPQGWFADYLSLPRPILGGDLQYFRKRDSGKVTVFDWRPVITSRTQEELQNSVLQPDLVSTPQP